MKKNEKQAYERFKKAAQYMIDGLWYLGFDDPENFAGTQDRVAKALMEIYSGCNNTQEQVDHILSKAFPANGHDDMVIASNVVVFSMCPHHLLPVEYHIAVGYIPSKEDANSKVLGLSKLARLAEVLAKRPVLQETLTQDIVKELEKLNIAGAAVIVNGKHMCMRMRGAEKRESSVMTSAMTGVFKSDSSTRAEFMNLVSGSVQF